MCTTGTMTRTKNGRRNNPSGASRGRKWRMRVREEDDIEWNGGIEFILFSSASVLCMLFALEWCEWWFLSLQNKAFTMPLWSFAAFLRSVLMWKCESESISHLVVSLFVTPMDCSSLPAFSVHRILQARILEWVAIPFSRESSLPKDGTQVSCISDRYFNVGLVY